MSTGKKYSYWLHTGIYSFLQRISVMFFGIASFSVLARAMSTEHMGVWAHFLALTANIELIRWAIVKNAFIKYLSVHYHEAKDEITTAALALNIVVTASIALLIVCLMPLLSEFLKAPELTRQMRIFLLGLLLLIPFSHFEWIQNSQGDFKGIFVAYLVRQGSWFLMMVIHLLIFGKVSLPYLSTYYSLGILFGALVAYRFVRKYLNDKTIFVKEWFLKLWRYGRIILGSSFNTMVFKNVDQMMVSNIISLTAVALYNVSLRIRNLLDMPSYIIGDIMFPKSAQVHPENNKARLKEMYEKSVGAVLSIVVPGGLFICIFPKLILIILAGPKYLDAAFVVRLMLINSIFGAFIKQFGTIMDSSGKARLNFNITGMMAVMSIVFCYIFTRMIGLPGAVAGIILMNIIGFCFSQYYLHKHYGVQFWKAFGHALRFYPEIFTIAKERILVKWRTSF
jgi:lipopolysaccharide exporter